MVELVDTHAHLHSGNYPLDADEVLASAQAAGVSRVICVGTTLSDSQRAIEFARTRQKVWAGAGIHPHEATDFLSDPQNRPTI